MNLILQLPEQQFVRTQTSINAGYLENQWCWFWTQGVTCYPNMAHTFLLLNTITNDNTVKLIQIDTMSPDSAHVGSNNSCEHSLIGLYTSTAYTPHLPANRAVCQQFSIFCPLHNQEDGKLQGVDQNGKC